MTAQPLSTTARPTSLYTDQHARPIDRAYCAEHDVPSAELGLFASYAVVVDYLHHVGLRARGPFECPLASDLRA